MKRKNTIIRLISQGIREELEVFEQRVQKVLDQYNYETPPGIQVMTASNGKLLFIISIQMWEEGTIPPNDLSTSPNDCTIMDWLSANQISPESKMYQALTNPMAIRNKFSGQSRPFEKISEVTRSRFMLMRGVGVATWLKFCEINYEYKNSKPNLK